MYSTKKEKEHILFAKAKTGQGPAIKKLLNLCYCLSKSLLRSYDFCREDKQDLVAEAFWYSLNHFNPERDILFSSYFTNHLRCRALDYSRSYRYRKVHSLERNFPTCTCSVSPALPLSEDQVVALFRNYLEKNSELAFLLPLFDQSVAETNGARSKYFNKLTFNPELRAQGKRRSEKILRAAVTDFCRLRLGLS